MLNKFAELTTKQKTIVVVFAGITMFFVTFLIGFLIGTFYLN
ncbi:hypothetical protein [Alkalicoccus luteus]|nr:hypothetical protein [Alkalicoccus luteus]